MLYWLREADFINGTSIVYTYSQRMYIGILVMTVFGCMFSISSIKIFKRETTIASNHAFKLLCTLELVFSAFSFLRKLVEIIAKSAGFQGFLNSGFSLGFYYIIFAIGSTADFSRNWSLTALLLQRTYVTTSPEDSQNSSLVKRKAQRVIVLLITFVALCFAVGRFAIQHVYQLMTKSPIPDMYYISQNVGPLFHTACIIVGEVVPYFLILLLLVVLPILLVLRGDPPESTDDVIITAREYQHIIKKRKEQMNVTGCAVALGAGHISLHALALITLIVELGHTEMEIGNLLINFSASLNFFLFLFTNKKFTDSLHDIGSKPGEKMSKRKSTYTNYTMRSQQSVDTIIMSRKSTSRLSNSSIVESTGEHVEEPAPEQAPNGLNGLSTTQVELNAVVEVEEETQH